MQLRIAVLLCLTLKCVWCCVFNDILSSVCNTHRPRVFMSVKKQRPRSNSTAKCRIFVFLFNRCSTDPSFCVALSFNPSKHISFLIFLILFRPAKRISVEFQLWHRVFIENSSLIKPYIRTDGYVPNWIFHNTRTIKCWNPHLPDLVELWAILSSVIQRPCCFLAFNCRLETGLECACSATFALLLSLAQQLPI